MTRRRQLGALIAAAVLTLLTACTTPAVNEPAAQATDAPVVQPEPTSTPTPSPTPAAAAPVEVDPTIYTDEYVPGVNFGVAGGQVNCQINEAWGGPAVAAWGCAVFQGQTWRWEDTAFAQYCAQFEEGGCRNGLVVRGSEPPTPRRNTDADFGGYPATHLLAAGERITVGTVSCEPLGDGVYCEDTSSGHGFELSPAMIEAW